MAGLEATPAASRWLGEGAPWLSSDMLAQNVRNHAIPEGHRFEVSVAVFPRQVSCFTRFDGNFPQTGVRRYYTVQPSRHYWTARLIPTIHPGPRLLTLESSRETKSTRIIPY